MKKRFLYVFLFGVPGLFVSLIVSFAISGALSGFLWLFVFGDNVWPSSVEIILPLIFFFTFVLSWVIICIVGYSTGKTFEADPEFDKQHIMMSVIATIVPILFIGIYQFKVGNIGQKSDGRLCSDYCRDRGYSASGMPPKNTGERTCICYDDRGQEDLKITIDDVASDPA